jgi:hypothetical protein
MSRMNGRKSRIAGLLALALGAVALLALSGVATAQDRGGDDNGNHGHHGHHGRHHHHHFREVEEAGTISSFDTATGRLTIALKGGETVSGLVTDETRIRCEGADDHRADRRDHGGDDNGGRGGEPGDDNGGHGNEPGDDNGGHGNEAGDDNGGGNEPGDDNGGNSGRGPSGEAEGPNGQAPSCTTAALVPGAFVGDAELRFGSGAATFTEVELGHHS